jgi:hypothetical protein
VAAVPIGRRLTPLRLTEKQHQQKEMTPRLRPFDLMVNIV